LRPPPGASTVSDEHTRRRAPSAATPSTEPATDVDRFIATHQPSWDELDVLVRRAGRDPRRLSTEELDELVRLHLRTSSHLSTARTHLHDAELTAWLSQLVARSTAVVHGTRPRSWRTVIRALAVTFPAAVWHLRREVAVATVVFVVAGLAVGIWLATSPAAVEVALPAEAREAYLEEDFEAYYSSEPAAAFAARVFTNNAGVGALAFGVGIAFGVPTLLVLALNGVNVGVAGGLFHAAGDAGTFWGLILPHGLLELTAVFVAGGAGLRLGWAAIAPGERTRREALAEEGRRAIVIVLALVVVFAIAGVLEAFVTPAPWPTWARVGTGAAVWALISAWVVVIGRRAAAQGLTGAMGEEPVTSASGGPAWAVSPAPRA
jgi:uncharacterized membrane protein SpoIIM required for sporulation